MDAKTIAWVSYLTIIGWIIAFVSYGNLNPKTSLATFHLRQSLGLILLGVACSIIFRMMFWAFHLSASCHPLFGYCL